MVLAAAVVECNGGARGGDNNDDDTLLKTWQNIQIHGYFAENFNAEGHVTLVAVCLNAYDSHLDDNLEDHRAIMLMAW